MKKKDPTSHRIIEKRRRDRMNNCLADLSKLIPTHYMKKGRGRIEKTEIIEMAIKHLKDLIGQTSASSSSPSSAAPSSAPPVAKPCSAGLPDSAAAAIAPTTNHHNGAEPSLRAAGQGAHCQSGGQLVSAATDEHTTRNNPFGPKSGHPRAPSSNSSSSCSLSSLSPSDNGPLASRQPACNNSCAPMMICSENLEQPTRAASSSKRKAPPISVPNAGLRRHHRANAFISDQDFQHLANVNKTLATIKIEPDSPPAATLPLPIPLITSKTLSLPANTAPAGAGNKSYQNHYHNGLNSHPHHHHQHHAQPSANSACFNGSESGACPLNAPASEANNYSSGSEGLGADFPSASNSLTSAAHQHHHQLHKYRSSPNSSGSDSGGSSSSYGSSGDNGAGSSGDMSGSSSGHRAGGSSCSMRTSCSSSSVTSMNPGIPSRPIGLVVDRGTTTSLQAAMAAATVTANKPVGGDTSANSGSSSSSLNSISSDVLMAASPVRLLPVSGATSNGATTESADVVVECCTCGSRILQTQKQQRVSKGGGSSSDSSMGSNAPADKPTALANKSQSASNQVDPDSLDFAAKTMIGASKQALASNKRRSVNGDNKCNNMSVGSLRPGPTRHHSNSSSGLHSSAHSAANSSTSSSSNSTLSLASSNSSAAWYKKAWLVRSFSRSPTPR